MSIYVTLYDDYRWGKVTIASIPHHITRDGRADRPYLRFGVNDETVVLTVRHVRQIHNTLGKWLREQEAEA